MRVHELAKKYDKNNKEMLEIIKKLGIKVSSHLSGLNSGDVKKVEEELNKGKDKPKKTNGNNVNIKDKNKENNMNPKEEIKEDTKIVKVKEEVSIKEFAEKMGLNPAEIVKKLFLKGNMFTINSVLPFELAEEIALEYDTLIELEVEEEQTYGEKFNLEEEDSEKDLEERPAVITIMGHVDHGKTSLLDAIRKTDVVAGESGGITQKIGAYQITRDDKKITFIDTPGHEAFTDMRSRGAKVTDIAILVVAADDGVMPQTVEAISHAKEAGVPIIVAVNKIDKPGAEPMKVKQELMEYNLVSVEWGGDVEFVEVSAKQRLNIENLLDAILITAELLELKANSKKRAKGVVIESRLDPKMGPVADVLIQEGELKVGEAFVSGEAYGKVRALINDKAQKVKSAGLCMPIEIIGFNTVPEAGDILYVIKNEKLSKKIVEDFIKEKKVKEQQKKKRITLEELSKQLEADKLKELKLIIRADSKGSVEALKESLYKLSNEEVMVNIIQASAGAITEGDVKLAEASDAIIIGFHVRPTTKARNEAEKENVEIRTYNVIYHITEDLEKAVKGMLSPEYKEVYQGRAEIKRVFKISKIGNIAGSVVIDGKISSSSNIRVLRNGIIIYEGKLSSLKRFTNDASEVVAGQECGFGIEGFNDLKEGDQIEAYINQEVPKV